VGWCMESPLEKVLEAAISYEQVLLSQISYCSKLTDLLSETLSSEGAQYLRRRYLSLVVCVGNLISLLPKHLRLKVFSREREIMRRIDGYASKYECLKRDTCKGEEIEAIISEVSRAMYKEIPEYAHLINYVVAWFVKEGTASLIGLYQLRLALVVDVLMEEGVIGLKQSSLFVGRVGVPEQPDQGGLRE
jgi:hypothetical protein